LTIEAAATEVKHLTGDAWIGTIYREQILPLRTRSSQIRAAARGEEVEPHHTLLGIELKIGRHRYHCPDLATARYLAIWSRAGCTEIAIPYDITQISRLADDLESGWHRMLLLIDYIGINRILAFRSRVRSHLLGELQTEIRQAGAGPLVPTFNQNTKQRAQRM
jgi:hypothetical protein